MLPIHPLQIISATEIQRARDVVLDKHDNEVVNFREIFLQEPLKAELIRFLDLEHRDANMM
jgi:primary-amine oxidase